MLHSGDMEEHRSYQAALQNPWPFQSHGDAVEKNKGQDHVIKELMGDDGLAEHSEPARRDGTGETDEEEVRLKMKPKKESQKIIHPFVLI